MCPYPERKWAVLGVGTVSGAMRQRGGADGAEGHLRGRWFSSRLDCVIVASVAPPAA